MWTVKFYVMQDLGEDILNFCIQLLVNKNRLCSKTCGIDKIFS